MVTYTYRSFSLSHTRGERVDKHKRLNSIEMEFRIVTGTCEPIGRTLKCIIEVRTYYERSISCRPMISSLDHGRDGHSLVHIGLTLVCTVTDVGLVHT